MSSEPRPGDPEERVLGLEEYLNPEKPELNATLGLVLERKATTSKKFLFFPGGKKFLGIGSKILGSGSGLTDAELQYLADKEVMKETNEATARIEKFRQMFDGEEGKRKLELVLGKVAKENYVWGGDFKKAKGLKKLIDSNTLSMDTLQRFLTNFGGASYMAVNQPELVESIFESFEQAEEFSKEIVARRRNLDEMHGEKSHNIAELEEQTRVALEALAKESPEIIGRLQEQVQVNIGETIKDADEEQRRFKKEKLGERRDIKTKLQALGEIPAFGDLIESGLEINDKTGHDLWGWFQSMVLGKNLGGKIKFSDDLNVQERLNNVSEWKKFFKATILKGRQRLTERSLEKGSEKIEKKTDKQVVSLQKGLDRDIGKAKKHETRTKAGIISDLKESGSDIEESAQKQTKLESRLIEARKRGINIRLAEIVSDLKKATAKEDILARLLNKDKTAKVSGHISVSRDAVAIEKRIYQSFNGEENGYLRMTINHLGQEWNNFKNVVLGDMPVEDEIVKKARQRYAGEYKKTQGEDDWLIKQTRKVEENKVAGVGSIVSSVLKFGKKKERELISRKLKLAFADYMADYVVGRCGAEAAYGWANILKQSLTDKVRQQIVGSPEFGKLS